MARSPRPAKGNFQSPSDQGTVRLGCPSFREDGSDKEGAHNRVLRFRPHGERGNPPHAGVAGRT
ncbi:hypothetical protein AD943_08540 [Gluconobacter roseus]|nr:hypothetical protein AD943_08540 [Gluconobacter roseus]